MNEKQKIVIVRYYKYCTFFASILLYEILILYYLELKEQIHLNYNLKSVKLS